MSWNYAYTPYIWPTLSSAAFGAAMGIYAWRHRVPGMVHLAFASLFWVLWAVGATLELAAIDATTRIFWVKFQFVCQLPTATAVLCFILEYVDPGRWLTRRTIALLAIAPLLAILLAATNDLHHWLWEGFTDEAYPGLLPGSLTWALGGYAYLITALPTGMLLWLFVRSPLHRWPAALLLIGQLVTHFAILVDITDKNPFAPMDPTIVIGCVTFALYALALFRFHLFDLMPVARESSTLQMQEGMLVLDAGRRIVDLNPAAEKILGTRGRDIRGQSVQLLPAKFELSARLDDPQPAPTEIDVEMGGVTRHYELHLSRLKGRRGVLLGHLILLQDVTEQKRAQVQLLEEQRVLAMLEERELMAQELHDSLSQELAFINVQAQAIRERLSRGESAQAKADLTHLASVARKAQTDTRDLIAGVLTGPSLHQNLGSALQRYVQQFACNNLQVELIAANVELVDRLGLATQAQLMRIIQEGLTNIRKHSQAHRACVSFTAIPGFLQVVIEDDGVGFDLGNMNDESRQYGLRIMRERAAKISGSVKITSSPGQGTHVVVEVPIESDTSPGPTLSAPPGGST